MNLMNLPDIDSMSETIDKKEHLLHVVLSKFSFCGQL